MNGQWDELRHVASQIGTLLENEGLKGEWDAEGLSRPGPRPTLAVLTGQWKSGRTTLLNGLVGSPGLLPTGPLPVTRFITEVRRASSGSIDLEFGGEYREFATEEELKNELAALMESPPEDAWVISVGLPSTPFPDAVLADTPGGNAHPAVQAFLFNEYLPRADAVIHLVHASFAGQADDVERLERVLSRIRPSNLFLVFNHAGGLDPQERRQLEDFLLARLELDEQPAGVFFTEASAARPLPGEAPGDGDESGVGHLRRALRRYLDTRGDLAVRQGYARRMADLGSRQITIWKSELENLGRSEAEIRMELAETRRRLDEARRELAAKLELANSSLEMIGSRARAEFQSRFLEVGTAADEKIRAMDDPDSRSERSALISSVCADIDEVVRDVVAGALDRLSAELRTIPEQVPQVRHTHADLSFPETEPIDLKGLIADRLEQLGELVDYLRPVLESVSGGKLRKILTRIPRGPQWRSLAGKLTVVLEPILDKLEKEEKRTALRSNLGERLSEMGAELDDAIRVWWEDLVPAALDDVKRRYEQSSAERLEPLEAAASDLEKGRAKAEARRAELEKLIAGAEELLHTLEGVSRGES